MKFTMNILNNGTLKNGIPLYRIIISFYQFFLLPMLIPSTNRIGQDNNATLCPMHSILILSLAFLSSPYPHRNPSFFFSLSFFLTTSACLSLQLLFLSLMGRFPTYLPATHRGEKRGSEKGKININ